jgi:hypothetical protein
MYYLHLNIFFINSLNLFVILKWLEKSELSGIFTPEIASIRETSNSSCRRRY